MPRRRAPIAITIGIVGALVIAFFVFAGIYADVLWYQQLGFVEVLVTEWIARIVLFLIGFAAMALPALVPAAHAQPGVITLALPPGTDSQRLGNRLARVGCRIAWESAYLRERNWVQVCLMGAWRPAAVEVLPALLRRYAQGIE